MLKVTVIIPVYNTAAHLPKCLDSVKNQHFKNLEVLLIDDASTDGSNRICADYAAADDRFQVIRHETHRGTAAARNTGLDHATGDFVYLLDSYLWLEPGCISRLAKTMVDDKSDMGICSFVIEEGKKTGHQRLTYTPFGIWTTRNWLDNSVKAENSYEYIWNRMFKRILFSGLRFDETLSYSEIALMPELMESSVMISSFDRILVHYPIYLDQQEHTVGKHLLDKLTALEQKKAFYDAHYSDIAWFVDRQIVTHCLKILKLRAIHGSFDALDAALPEIRVRLQTLSAEKRVCTGKLKRDCMLACKLPGLFDALARMNKKV